MEAYARAPDPLTNVGDMASNWKSWKEDFIIFMKVTGYIDKPNEIRANLLKNRIGIVGIDAIQNISFENPQDKDNMDILIVKLEEFFNPPKNEVIERYQFFTTSKKQNESIEQYINILREKAQTCNFKEMTESIIRDKIVLDTNDKALRKKLFEANNLNLQKIIKIYNNHKNNTEKTRQPAKENKVETRNLTTGNVKNNVKRGNCWRCGHQHPLGKCPAWGSKCTKCFDINHFTQCCKGPKLNIKTNNDKVNTNLLDPLQFTKIISKSSDSLWNYEADTTTETKTSVNKMISLPDIPAAFCDTASSASENDSIHDFVLLNTCNSSSKDLCYNNAVTVSPSAYSSKNTYTHSYSDGANQKSVTDSHKEDKTTKPTQSTAYLSKNTQYSYSNVNGANPEWITDLRNKNEATKPAQSDTYLPRNTQYIYSNAYEVEQKSVTDLHKKDETTKPAQSTVHYPRSTQYTYSNAYRAERKSARDLLKEKEPTKSTYLPSSYGKPKNDSKKMPFDTPKFKQSRNKKKDDDVCILS